MRRRTEPALVLAILLGGASCSTDALVPLRLIGPYAANGATQVTTRFEQPYADRGGQALFYDLYSPDDAATPLPLVIAVHGGYWRSGSRKDIAEFAYDIAAHGYVVASIDYRLARDGVVFPAPVSDVFAAIRYFRENAAQFNLDPARIALFGRSAGAHLALLVAMAPDAHVFDPERPVGETAGVKAVISVSGPTDLTVDSSTATDLQRDSVENFLGQTLENAGNLLRVASPVIYARAGGPPVLMIHGDIDAIVPVDQAYRLNGALRAAGQYADLHVYPGMDHLINAVWFTGFAQQYREDILDFLNSRL